MLDELLRVRARVYADKQVLGESGRVFEPFPTGMGLEAGLGLRAIVERERASRTIETGLAFGLSTLFMLEATMNRPGARHVAVDPYQARDWDNAGLLTLRKAGVERLVEFIREDSMLALPRLVTQGREFDLGFVDGGHHFENAFLDTCYMHRLVRPGGVIVVDDVWMPAVRAAVTYFTANLGSVEERGDKRFAVLRVAERQPKRTWDHFVEFRGAGVAV